MPTQFRAPFLPATIAPRWIWRYGATDKTGDPSSYIHIKDVMDLISPETFMAPIPEKRLRHLISISKDAELEDAMTALRRRGAHVAKTLDAHGQVTGLLFLEDVLEVLVGEVKAAAETA